MKRLILAWTLVLLNLAVWAFVLSCAGTLAPLPKEAVTVAAVSFEVHDFLMKEVSRRVSALVKEERTRFLTTDESTRLKRLIALGLTLDLYAEAHNTYLTALRYYQAAANASEAVRRDALKNASDERQKVRDLQRKAVSGAMALNLPLPRVITTP